MQIHRIRGRTLADALQRARAAHGEEALVLSQELAPGGGVTIAVAEREVVVPAPPGRAAAASPGLGLDEVRRRLSRSGCSRRFVERVVERVEQSGAEGMYALDAAARAIGELFPIAPSPKLRGATRVLALVGPTGVGKTTTLAKLALRLTRGGRSALFATLDTYRVGAVDQLRTYAELMELPLIVARDGGELVERLARAPRVEVVLLDTTGRSPRDVESLARIAADLTRTERAAELDTYLVLSATAAGPSFDEARHAFAPAGPIGLVLTKLDETSVPGAALEALLETGLATALLCDGQDVSAHLWRARADHFADLCLRGRIP